MMRILDFSSWQAVITTLFGLVVVTFMMVGIRLLVMETVQQRRQRENRQINERLRTLIAAYKTLGGSFTGDLAVDPAHLRDFLRQRPSAESTIGGATEMGEDISATVPFDRSRRISRCRRSGVVGRDPARQRGAGAAGGWGGNRSRRRTPGPHRRTGGFAA